MKILVLPGDGIGVDVCNAALPVFDALKLDAQLEHGDIGWKFWQEEGTSVPERTWKKIEESDAVLLGATTSKGKKQALEELSPSLRDKNPDDVSPIIQLRKRLDLFANIRPCELFHGNSKPFRLCIIRENTEGLYAGIDRKGIPSALSSLIEHENLRKNGSEEATFSIRLQTRFGLERIFRSAFSYAREHYYKRVTLADKPNVLRESGQFAADIFHAIAQEYPEIKADVQNVDAVALWLVQRPEEFGVIVAENMFGDILSDLAAGMMGGLGFAPSANLGTKIPYFEPVHGSASRHAGQNKVNPSAMFLTIALLLKHFDLNDAAARITSAVKNVVRQGKFVTYDVGGKASTSDMAKAILEEIVAPQSTAHAQIICIGNELLSGRVVNTNASKFSKILTNSGFKTCFHHVCSDQPNDITHLVAQGLQSDVLIVSGGLGPTSNDMTRQSIAQALDLPLEYREEAARAVQQRLEKIGLKIDEISKKQAYFPVGSETIPNPNGTAQGFIVAHGDCKVYVVPGPPRESVPMLKEIFKEVIIPLKKTILWRLLGIVESDLSLFVEEFFSKRNMEVDVETYWSYPYVDLMLRFKGDPLEGLLEELHSKLSLFLVDLSGRSASELLEPYLRTHNFRLEDSLTNGFLEKCFLERGVPSNLYSGKEIFVKVTADQSIDPPFQGTIHLTCFVEDKKFDIKFPKARPEIVDYIFEFVSWSLLRKIQNA